MSERLLESQTWCREVTRREAGNFYYSFLTLPAAEFQDMCSLYAFMRVTDDIGDDPERSVPDRLVRLDEWRLEFERSLNGDVSSHVCLPAIVELTRRREIPVRHLTEVIDGVQLDLTGLTIETFSDLERYCYLVAGAVGLCCIHVWGFESDEALTLAVDCGLAFQLTNIIRDVAEDARTGRIYLPAEDLERFGYHTGDLEAGVDDERFQALMQFQADRARSYYRKALRLHDLLAPPGRPILASMLRLYGGLLDRLEHKHFPVFEQRVHLPVWQKLWISVDTLWRYRYGRARLPRTFSTHLESAASSPSDPLP